MVILLTYNISLTLSTWLISEPNVVTLMYSSTRFNSEISLVNHETLNEPILRDFSYVRSIYKMCFYVFIVIQEDKTLGKQKLSHHQSFMLTAYILNI